MKIVSYQNTNLFTQATDNNRFVKEVPVVITVDWVQRLITEGSFFTHMSDLVLAAGTYRYRFATPAGYNVILYLNASADLNTILTMYEGAIVSAAGTAVAGLNPNRLSGNDTHLVVFESGATYSDNGTKLGESMQIASDTGKPDKARDAFPLLSTFILKREAEYQFEFVIAGADTNLELNWAWAERDAFLNIFPEGVEDAGV